MPTSIFRSFGKIKDFQHLYCVLRRAYTTATPLRMPNAAVVARERRQPNEACSGVRPRPSLCSIIKIGRGSAHNGEHKDRL